MEKTYFVQRKTMSGIADEVRELSGKGTMLNPEQMTTELDSANVAVDDQADVINEIREILANKRIPEDGLEGADEYVDFYDYDGTLLHRFTVLEIQGMTELPTLPQHEGLICQGWNWTLEQLKDENGGVDVAPFYKTDSGNTRIHIDLPYDGIEMSTFIPSGMFYIKINWGDGVGFVENQTTGRLIHQYSKAGKYVIEIDAGLGDDKFYYLNIASQSIFGSGNTHNGAQFITKIECGDNLKFYNGAFRDMYSLETVTQPSNIGYQVDDIVRMTPRLKQFIIGSYPGQYCVYESVCRCIFSYNTSHMAKYAFYNYRGAARLPKTFNARIAQGFYNATGLRTYESRNVSNIPDEFFSNSKIQKINIPVSVNNIGIKAFCGSDVKTVYINDGIATLGTSCFQECVQLSTIRLSNTLKSVPAHCFYSCRSLEEIELPDSIESIDNYAFCDTSLSKVNIPKNLVRVGYSAFENTNIRGDIVLPNTVTMVAQRAFYSCSLLTSVKLSENLTILAKQSFYDCSAIKTITIPKNILTIEDSALYGNIQAVYFTEHESVPTIANSNSMPSKAKIYVPSALYDEWIKATNWSAIASRIVPV